MATLFFGGVECEGKERCVDLAVGVRVRVRANPYPNPNPCRVNLLLGGLFLNHQTSYNICKEGQLGVGGGYAPPPVHRYRKGPSGGPLAGGGSAARFYKKSSNEKKRGEAL